MPRRCRIKDDNVESRGTRQVNETLESCHLFGAGRGQLLRHRSNGVFVEFGPRVIEDDLLVVLSRLLLIDLGCKQPRNIVDRSHLVRHFLAKHAAGMCRRVRGEEQGPVPLSGCMYRGEARHRRLADSALACKEHLPGSLSTWTQQALDVSHFSFLPETASERTCGTSPLP